MTRPDKVILFFALQVLFAFSAVLLRFKTRSPSIARPLAKCTLGLEDKVA